MFGSPHPSKSHARCTPCVSSASMQPAKNADKCEIQASAFPHFCTRVTRAAHSGPMEGPYSASIFLLSGFRHVRWCVSRVCCARAFTTTLRYHENSPHPNTIPPARSNHNGILPIYPIGRCPGLIFYTHLLPFTRRLRLPTSLRSVALHGSLLQNIRRTAGIVSTRCTSLGA